MGTSQHAPRPHEVADAESQRTALTRFCFIPFAVISAEPAVAADAVIISFVSESSDANGVRTVDVVRALQSDTIQEVKLRLRTRGHRVSNGHALVRLLVTLHC